VLMSTDAVLTGTDAVPTGTDAVLTGTDVVSGWLGHQLTVCCAYCGEVLVPFRPRLRSRACCSTSPIRRVSVSISAGAPRPEERPRRTGPPLLLTAAAPSPPTSRSRLARSGRSDRSGCPRHLIPVGEDRSGFLHAKCQPRRVLA
jgi:hypothetical protein